jgi:hypothetical protein
MKKIFCFTLVMMLFFSFFIQSTGSINISVEKKEYRILMPPDLVYDPTSHDFGFVEEGETYVTSFQIWNAGPNILTWNLGIVDPWLSPSPTSGDSTGEKDTVTVTIDTTGLSNGAYSGSISINANDGGGLRYFDVDFFVDAPPNRPSIPSGSNTGIIDEEYSYFTSSTDPDGDWIAYRIDFGNRISDWTMHTASGIGNSIDNIWTTPGSYNVKAQAKDLHGMLSEWSLPLNVVITSGENNPPDKPNPPTGPSSGAPDTEYQYTAFAIDPEDDRVLILFDWGDGSDSGWEGPINSSESITISHVWIEEGDYSIKVKAMDTNFAESEWSDPIVVSMPKSHNSLQFIFNDLINNFPILGLLLTKYL